MEMRAWCIYFIGFTIVFLGGLAHFSIAEEAASVLPQPTITISPDVYYPLDEVLYIEGRAKPNSSVQVQFQKQGAKLFRFGVKSDASGEWVLAEKVPFEAGDWEIRARLVEGEEKVSGWSNPRVIKAIQTGITIGGVNIKFALIVFSFLILVVVASTAFLYFGVRVRQLKNALFAKEIREAKESVEQGISEIRKDLLDELGRIESSGRAPARDEIERKEHILRELDALGRTMGREISDIERNV